jgi:hypothetical protein
MDEQQSTEPKKGEVQPYEPERKWEREALAIRSDAQGIAPLVPQTLEEAFRLAQYIVAAKLAPNSYDDDPRKVVIGIMKSMEVGVAPLTGLANIAIVNNRPCVWGDLAIALVQRTGSLEKMVTNEIGEPPDGELNKWPDSFGIRFCAWRKGQDEPYEGTFTVGDAKRAKLWLNPRKSPWMDYPKRMLFHRARAIALRDGFADALSGLAIREEVEDMEHQEKSVVDTDFLEARRRSNTSRRNRRPTTINPHRPQHELDVGSRNAAGTGHHGSPASAPFACTNLRTV